MAREKIPSQADYHKPQMPHPSHRLFEKLPPRGEVSERSEQIIRQIREQMKEFVNQKPNKDWARRVLDRHASGEPIFALGVQWAREVVEQHGREPGSDDT